jgi:hypothetical protein
MERSGNVVCRAWLGNNCKIRVHLEKKADILSQKYLVYIIEGYNFG